MDGKINEKCDHLRQPFFYGFARGFFCRVGFIVLVAIDFLTKIQLIAGKIVL